MINPRLCKPETTLRRSFGLLFVLILRLAWFSTRLTSISANALTSCIKFSLTVEEPVENWGTLKASEKGVADEIPPPGKEFSFGSPLEFRMWRRCSSSLMKFMAPPTIDAWSHWNHGKKYILNSLLTYYGKKNFTTELCM